MLEENLKIPDDWMVKELDWNRIAYNLAIQALNIPSIKERAKQLILLILGECSDFSK